MKQHITIEQLNELSDDAKRNLYTWQKKKGYHREGEVDWDDYWENSTMSIGQMIEFLGEHRDTWIWEINSYYENQDKVILDGGDKPDYRKRKLLWEVTQSSSNGATYQDWSGELVNALWEAVKEVLEV